MFIIDGNNVKKVILSIFVPCFNEEDSIFKTLSNIKKGIKNIPYEILISNDASTDNTLKKIEKFQKKNSKIKIRIFSNKKNKGLGYNFWAIAKKASGKYYMIVFGDGALPPSELNKIVKKIGKADIILSYFTDLRGNLRKTLSKLFVFLINLIILKKIKYFNSDNIYLLSDVKSIKKGGSGFAYQAELISELIKKNKTFIEVKIKPYFNSKRSLSEVSSAFKFNNIVSVIKSIIHIFFSQIIYLFKNKSNLNN